jgi:hypothetical protein
MGGEVNDECGMMNDEGRGRNVECENEMLK